jgi:UTP--glucose-1-phosphate uridylyltransferase
VAGRGTRLLPATKAVRKELLPIGRKPLILYAVEEAATSGIDHIIFVCARSDSSLQRFFERDIQLEHFLDVHGVQGEAEKLRAMFSGLRFSFVNQSAPLGLADAIRCARPEIKDEAFGVILPDALIISQNPCIAQLAECYRRHRRPVIATRLVQMFETRRYGILVVDSERPEKDMRTVRVRSMVEKPSPQCAPSLYGVFGRYVLAPEVFDAIDNTQPDPSGELQLTDALNSYCNSNPVYGYLFEGRHIDTGNWHGFVEATIECLLADVELAPVLSRYMSPSSAPCNN